MINLYEPRAVRNESGTFAGREPNFSVKHVSSEVIVTIGALRNRFFNKKELEENFTEVINTVETTASKSSLTLKDVLSTVRSI